MNRRGFLGAIAAAVASSRLDPEKLLWVPGRKLVSVPRPAPIATPEVMALWGVNSFLKVGDVITFGGRYVENPPTGKYVVLEVCESTATLRRTEPITREEYARARSFRSSGRAIGKSPSITRDGAPVRASFNRSHPRALLTKGWA